MKTAKHYLDEANAIVPKMDAADAVKIHAAGTGVFVDVRDSSGIADTGTIAGAQRITRGMIEFMADSDHALHNAALQKDAAIYVVCAAGGQAALAGKTLNDMGYSNVTNIGGISGWKDAGGPTEA